MKKPSVAVIVVTTSMSMSAPFLGCANPEINAGGGRPGSGGGNQTGGSSGGQNQGGSGVTVPGFDLPDAGPGAPPSSRDASCGFQNYMLERRPAELLLVLDRSGSMRERATFTALTSKWEDTVPALTETIMTTSSAVSWGMKLFPGEQLSCAVADGVEVPIAANNQAAMLAAITATTPTGTGTPTTSAMQKAVAQLKANPSPNPRYILLATDGEPNCADGVTNDLVDADGAVEAVRMAAAEGFKTFVVGIATMFGDANATLNRMAEAGGEPRMGEPRYYPVASRQDLIATLGLITGRVSDCVFPLDKLPPSPDDVAVDVNGTRVTRDRGKTNGWDYAPDGKSIQIHGPACEQIKNARAEVKIVFGCPGVEIP